MGYLRPFERAEVSTIDADAVEAMVSLVVDGCDSVHTRRAYSRAIRDFLSWYRETGQVGLSKAVVLRYVANLRAGGMGAASVNQRLSAIRKLAGEAEDAGVIGFLAAMSVKSTKGVKQDGIRLGLWLTCEEAQTLLDSPGDSLKGRRDRAILAVLMGCGLRRVEVARLTFENIQKRDGRWLVVDFVGKRNKTRSVVMPAWCIAAVSDWIQAGGIVSGPLFRHIERGGHVAGAISDIAVSWLIKEYGARLGFPDLAAHDLRRTFAKLARKGGADLEQIQLSLGHASLVTTQKYLGTALDLVNAPGDVVGLSL